VEVAAAAGTDPSIGSDLQKRQEATFTGGLFFFRLYDYSP
jgi:hypothetical protein